MLTLVTLGGVALFREGKPLGGRSSQRRRLALLAVLAVARERGISRDKVISYLWPEHDTNRARHALSQLLYAIRRDLGEDCIQAGVDDLRLNSRAVRTDVEAFEQARSDGNLDAAVAAYGGSFLDGFFITDAPDFEEWAAGERQRLQAAFSEVLEAQARVATERGELRGAAEWLLRRLQLEPLDSQSIVALMMALEAAGDRGEALRHGRRYVELLREEMGLEPSDVIQSMMARLARPQPIETDTAAAVPRVALEPLAQSHRPEVQDTSGALPHAEQSDRYAVPRRRPYWTPGATAVAVLFLALTAAVLYRTFDEDLIPRSVVLSAVEGPDSSLSLAVGEVLRTELAASGAVRLLGPASIHETLLLMKLDPAAPITEQTALEIAERRGIQFAITTYVVPLGTGARVTSQLRETTGQDSGRIVLSEHASVAEEVVPHVRRLARALEARIAGRNVQRSARDSLPAVSTSSLPALRAYAMARQAAARGDRWQAVSQGLVAIEFDSAFAMAHYLLGDQFWFLDRQSQSDFHLREAVRLSDRLPLRERLAARARYMHIVRDDLDSAAIYWTQLVNAYPREALGFEGRAWTYRAAGQYMPAYFSADSALRMDPDARSPNENNKLQALLEARPGGHLDTTAALAFAESLGTWAVVQARRAAAMERHDWDAALRSIDEAYPPMPGCGSYWAAPMRQSVFLAADRPVDAARELEVMLCWARGPGGWPLAQMYIPNALLLQGRAEVTRESTRTRALGYARRALDFVDSADISVPAVARMAERAADIAARGNDAATVARARRMVVTRDAGRGLTSYRLALLAIDASEAMRRGDMKTAAELALRARQRTFHGRGLDIITLIEADALAALGHPDRADLLYRQSLAPAAFLARRPAATAVAR